MDEYHASVYRLIERTVGQEIYLLALHITPPTNYETATAITRCGDSYTAHEIVVDGEKRSPFFRISYCESGAFGEQGTWQESDDTKAFRPTHRSCPLPPSFAQRVARAWERMAFLRDTFGFPLCDGASTTLFTPSGRTISIWPTADDSEAALLTTIEIEVAQYAMATTAVAASQHLALLDAAISRLEGFLDQPVATGRREMRSHQS
ncbi:hypothetical protein J2T57_004181 [Natronocella acetinitrilica]|uniref:Uncharacterized protein n=1 Tax=Natronocella acetinitrilica TaxID=414046 RepID=A0AAE3GB28_9GAMM|nr:hypothetical protein [Natronocella acetinitrilica]MCP1677007.1 hypothetical protein [Natronocella acetinitrilica]